MNEQKSSSILQMANHFSITHFSTKIETRCCRSMPTCISKRFGHLLLWATLNYPVSPNLDECFDTIP